MSITRLLCITVAALCFMPLAGAEATDEPEKPKKPLPGDEPGRTVEDILTRDPESDDYVETVDCILTSRIRDLDVLDEQHVAFRVGRDEYYLVRLPRRCPGLKRGNPVIYETLSRRLCRQDAIQGTTNFGLGRLEPGAKCRLNVFQSVTKEQIVQLQEAIDAEKRVRRENRKRQREERKQRKKEQREEQSVFDEAEEQAS